MSKKYKNVKDLIEGVFEDPKFKDEAIRDISENGLGKFLFFLRCQHQMTQEELAKKIGCTQGRISKIESSKDENLSIKDFIDYGNAFDLNLEIGFREKKATWVDMVKYHAFKMREYLGYMVRVAKEDESIEKGVLDFHFETLGNVPKMIRDSLSKMLNNRVNRKVSNDKSKVHVSVPIQIEENLEKEKISKKI